MALRYKSIKPGVYQTALRGLACEHGSESAFFLSHVRKRKERSSRELLKSDHHMELLDLRAWPRRMHECTAFVANSLWLI